MLSEHSLTFRQPSFNGDQHLSKNKIGVLITNLGTPDAATKSALRRYLKEFLSDRRVIEVPRLIWWLILNGIILNTRPKKSAELYKSVWTEQGSPLLKHTITQCNAIAEQFYQHNTFGDQSLHRERLLFSYAMRYGNPSIGDAIKELQANGVTQLLVLPLYPQYAAATTGSSYDAVFQQLARTRWVPALRIIDSYHDDMSYINACASRIQQYWQQHGRNQKLLFSFHGLPKDSLDKGDPYFCHCQKSARLIAETLELDSNDYLVTFQSRFGRAEWLQPYTDATLKSLPAKGVTSVDVFCPGFSADCLETLEEIAVENKRYFREAGGDNYRYIPALNASKEHVHALSQLIATSINDWLAKPQTDPGLTQQRAATLKATIGEESQPK